MRTMFGERLRRIRTARGLTQAQVAKIVGRTANTVARWERGEIAPDELAQAEVLRRVAARRR